jgi:hypothetical protein
MGKRLCRKSKIYYSTMKAQVGTHFAMVFVLITGLAACWGTSKGIVLGYDNRLWVYNNSNRNVCFETYNHYPDTSIGIFKPYFSVEPGDSSPIRIQGTWENYFNDAIKSDTLMIFVFDAHIVDSLDWYVIRQQQRYIKRYDLSYEELKNRNWRIIYP